MSSGRLTLVYDADCLFCIRSLKALKRLDWLNNLDLRPSSGVHSDERLRSLLAGADFSAAMYAVSRYGRTYTGFDAFRQALLRLPAGLLIVWSWYLPGARWLGIRCYNWIARRRHAFGCSASCKI